MNEMESIYRRKTTKKEVNREMALTPFDAEYATLEERFKQQVENDPRDLRIGRLPSRDATCLPCGVSLHRHGTVTGQGGKEYE